MATEAKLKPPLSSGALRRERLLAACRAPVVWVMGPAGSGKTTLVASHLHHGDRPGLWYRVDESDRDMASAYAALTRAVAGLAPSDCGTLPTFASDEHMATGDFARRFVEATYAVLPPNCALIFDDVHHVDGVAGWEALLTELCRWRPAETQLVAAGRAPPPASLARWRVHGTMSTVDADALRFDREDVAAWLEASRGADVEDDEVDRVLERTAGWSAAVVLLSSSSDERVLRESGLPDYFDNEVLESLSTAERNLLFLTSLPDTFDPALVCELFPKDGRATLSELRQRHLFIEELDGEPPSFRYHDLFREHLRSRAPSALGPAAWRNGVARVVDALQSRGRDREAVSLALDEGLHDSAGPLIVKLAPRLLEQGFVQTLAGWLAEMPEDRIASDGHLLEVRGMARRWLYDPRSLEDLQAAYDLHRAAGDEKGMLASWSELVAATGTFSGEVDLLRRALDELPRLPPVPDDDVELAFRVSASKLTVLYYRRPEDPDLDALAERVTTLALASRARILRAYSGSFLCIHWIMRAQPERGAVVLRTVVGSEEALPPFLRIVLATSKIFLAWLSGRGDDVASVEREAERLVARTGLESLRPLYTLMTAAEMLSTGRADEAMARIEPLWAMVEMLPAMVGSVAAVFRGWAALAGGRVVEAERRVREWEASDRLSQLPASDTLIVLAHGYCALHAGKLQEAGDRFERGLAKAERQRADMHVLGALAGVALVALARNDAEASERHTRRFCAMARERGVFSCFYLSPPDAARIAARALELGIEVDWVQELIERRHLPPPRPISALLGWPARLRVRMLGAFAIEVDGVEADLGRKIPRRQIELLGAIVADEADEVPVERVLDVVWPDADGDAAYRALKPTLHRLRTLLQLEDILTLRSGVLRLDPTRCWCDVHALRAIASAAARADADDATRLSSAFEEAYRGPFLESVSAGPWALQPRAQLDGLAEQTRAKLDALLDPQRAGGERVTRT